MAIYLTNQFVHDAQRDEYSVMFGDRQITLAATTAQAPGRLGYIAELQVMEGSSILGYITPYGDNERGAVRVNLFGIAAPRIFRTLDEALREIVR